MANEHRRWNGRLWRQTTLVGACVVLFFAPEASGSPLERGVGLNGQPGVLRTLTGLPGIPGSWVISANGNYGWQPNAVVEGDVAHCTSGRLALTYSPWSFFQAGLSLDQNVSLYNYNDEAGGLVSGAVGDPRLNLRTAFDLGRGFSLAAQFELWFPSGMGSFGFTGASISPSLDVAVSLTPETIPLGVHLQLGYHHNRTGVLLDEVTGFTPASLELSGATRSMHHLVVGLGFEYRIGPVAPLVELNTDLPLDNGGLDHTMLLIGVGARIWLGPSDAVQLLAGLEFSVLQDDVYPEGTDPLDPNALTGQTDVWESRPLLAVFLGLTVRLPVRSESGGGGTGVSVGPDDGAGGTVGPVPDASTGRGRIAGRVLCGTEPCGPSTTVQIGEGSSPLVVDEEQGTFTTLEVPAGTYRVTAMVEGVEPQSQSIEVVAGATADANFTLAVAITTGIRGRVTDFEGQPLQVQVRIPELDVEIESDAEGQFEVEAPPGAYQVMIWAEGYQTQTMRMEVTRGGMVVMNVELRARRGRRRR